MNILYFIEGLNSGGKERRLLELVTYLKSRTDYKLMIVVTDPEIHYQYINNIKVPVKVLERKLINKDPSIFFRFFNICLKFKPDIIHSWSNMTTTYAIPSSKALGIKLITSEIADAPPKEVIKGFFKFTWKMNNRFAHYILANSKAGLTSYDANREKSQVIYNGVRLDRFTNLTNHETVREKYHIYTKYIICMVASFSKNKDYNTFLEVSKRVLSERQDVTFLAVGGGLHLKKTKELAKSINSEKILFTGKISDVEDVVNVSDIGLLFTNNLNHGEGIPNTLIEFMALGKPVLANDAGGTKELVENNVSGFILKNKKTDLIVKKIHYLLDNPEIRKSFGKEGKCRIRNDFNLERMGKEFVKVYCGLLENKK